MPAREDVFGQDVGGHSVTGTRMEGPCDLGYRGLMPKALGFALRAGSDASASVSAMEEAEELRALAEDEEFADGRQIDAAEEESARRRAVVKAYPGATTITTLLILGLRRVRAEYMARLNAWAELQKIWMSPGGEDADGAGDGHLQPPQDTVAGVGPVIPRATADQALSDRIGQWANTAHGRTSVRHLRWAAGPVNVLAARLRAELGHLAHTSLEQLEAVCARIGIPISVGGRITWGESRPAWAAALAAWQVDCQCNVERANVTIEICVTCHGARRPLLPIPGGVCEWCNRACTETCSGCGCGLHYAGQCYQWMRGANPLYAAGDIDPYHLCPDCGWKWISLLAPQTRPVAIVDEASALYIHLRAVAAACLPGAGHARRAPPADVVRVGWAQRRILRGLARAAWVRVAVLVNQIAGDHARLQPMDGARNTPMLVQTVVRQAVSNLHAAGKLWMDGHGLRASVRLRRNHEVSARSHFRYHGRRSRTPR